MTARANSAEGGTSGAQVTTANSGGASGDAWSAVGIPSGTSLTFATAAAYKGSCGYRLTSGTASGLGANVRWSTAGWPLVRSRFYFRMTAYPSSSALVAYVTNAAGSQVLASVHVSASTGELKMRNASSNTVFASAAAVPLNTWLRVEFIVVPGTTSSNGTIRFAYATGDAAATQTYASTTANTGTGGNVGGVHFGKLTGTWNATVDLDDLAADDASASAFLGVSAASGTPVVVDPTPPPPPVVPSWPPPHPYSEAIRSGLAIWYSVSASRGGVPVEGASDLRPTGGTITDTTKPGVRRVLNLELAPTPGLYDLLSPEGTVLTGTAHVQYTNRTVIDIPMGVFEVDSEKISDGGGGLSLTAPDKWGRIQRAKFVIPQASTPGMPVSQQIAALIRGALGASEPVNVLTTSEAEVGVLTWDDDREKAIHELAAGIGAWVYFDRLGVATVAPMPVAGAGTSWLVDASARGVLTDLDRERSRSKTRNVVVVTSSSADEATFAPQVVWDSNPGSPTFAGTDPVNHPEWAGPFGVSVHKETTSLPLSNDEAQATAYAILGKVVGLASSVSLGQVPNPAVDAGDTVSVIPPRERYDIARVMEQHIADTVTTALAVGSSQHIDGRSTRTDEYA